MSFLGMGSMGGIGQTGDYGSGEAGGPDVFGLPSGTEQPPDYSTAGSSSGFDWNSLIQSWTQTASTILKANYGQPPAGTVITTANGQYIRYANGQMVPVASMGASIGTTPGNTSLMSLLVIGGGVFLIAMAMRGRG